MIEKAKSIILKCRWVLFVLLFKTSHLYCQVSDHTIPAGLSIKSKNAEVIPYRMLDPVLVEERTEEDMMLGIPNRYGIIQKINTDIRTVGLKTVIGDMIVWRYEIRCPDALSLGIYFDTYNVPVAAEVYIYSSDTTEIQGGFTSVNNKSGKKLATADVHGNSVIIEYDEPQGAEFPGELVVGYVLKAYRDLKSTALVGIGINCPAGINWQSEKHAVCLMSFVEAPYSYYCTGFLINNARQDGTPYFMTANHCISTNSVAGTLITYFNYENSSCNDYNASKKQTLSGAELKATSSNSDFTLLALSETPPDEYTPYFAGWDAGKDNTPTQGTCIHHPEGSYKCIAVDNNAPVNYPNTIQWDSRTKSYPNTHWKVTYDLGSDATGSSGSPLFDQNKHVIGQLHGGNEASSYFGKFSLSWDNSSIPNAQLKNWLDPDKTNISKLDGKDFYRIPEADFSVDVTKACLQTTIYISDKSKHSPTEWSWKIEPETYEFVSGTDEHSQNPQIMFTEAGSYSFTLVAGNSKGKDTISYENLVSALSDFNVILTGFPEEVTVCGSELKNYTMVADGANQYSYAVSPEDKVEKSVSLNVLSLTLKNEVRKYGSFDMVVKVTGSHGICTSSDSVLFHVVMPVNDDIANAIPLKLGRNAFFSNECGTVETFEPSPPASGCRIAGNWCPPSGAPLLNNSVWFTFPGTSNGIITVQTSGFESQIAVYEADSPNSILTGNYMITGAADNIPGSGSETVLEDIPVSLNKNYWLQVDGNNGAYGVMTIHLISNTIEVSPNPSDGIFHLTVSGKEEGNTGIEVYSADGRCIYSNSVSLDYDNNTITMDLSGKSPGMYFFRASINGLVMTKKLILTGHR